MVTKINIIQCAGAYMCGACKKFFYIKNEFFLIKSEFFLIKSEFFLGFLILALINEFKYNYNTHFLFKK